MNRGASIIQSYEAEQRCDNAVDAMQLGMEDYDRFSQTAEKNRTMVHEQVTTFRTKFTDCLRDYSLSQCSDAHYRVISANIDFALQELNEQERWDYDIASTRSQLRQNCSQYWTLSSYQVDTHYNDNRRVFAEWKAHIDNLHSILSTWGR